MKTGRHKLHMLFCSLSVRLDASPINFSNTKEKWVLRSVLGAELFAFADAVNAEMMLQHDLGPVIYCDMPLPVLTDTLQSLICDCEVHYNYGEDYDD